MPLARPHVPNLLLGARASPLRGPSPTATLGAASPLQCPSPRQGVNRGIVLGSGVGSVAAPPTGSARVGITPRMPASPVMTPQPTYGRLSTTYAVASGAPLPHGGPSAPVGDWRSRSTSPVVGGAAGSGCRNHSARSEIRSGSAQAPTGPSVRTTVSVEVQAPTDPTLEELERVQADLEEQLTRMRAQRRSRALRGEIEKERLLAELHALQQQEQCVALREEKARVILRLEGRPPESAVSSSWDPMSASAVSPSDAAPMSARLAASVSGAAPASARRGPSQAHGTERPPDAPASPQCPPPCDSLGDEQGSPHSAVLRADGEPSQPSPSPAAAGGCRALGSATTSGTVEAAFEGVAGLSGEASASADCAAGLRQLGGARGAEVPPLPSGVGRGAARMGQMGAVMWTPNANSRRTVPKA